jgi:hypothetical protein
VRQKAAAILLINNWKETLKFSSLPSKSIRERRKNEKIKLFMLLKIIIQHLLSSTWMCVCARCVRLGYVTFKYKNKKLFFCSFFFEIQHPLCSRISFTFSSNFVFLFRFSRAFVWVLASLTHLYRLIPCEFLWNSIELQYNNRNVEQGRSFCFLSSSFLILCSIYPISTHTTTNINKQIASVLRTTETRGRKIL